MWEILFFLILTGIYPLTRAWLANRRTSLGHALVWTCLAWTAWLAAWGSALIQSDGDAIRYAALCLSCCPGIAVLGAKRPGVAAWDLVVVGMLAVMLWPLLESAILGRDTLGTVNLMFLAGVLAVSVANYLPTRMGPTALLAGGGCVAEWLTLASLRGDSVHWFAGACIAAAPWLAYVSWPNRATASAIDRLWLDFRDRYGLAWSQRVCEQFNRAAGNAGWPVSLTWRGLRILPGTQVDATIRREMLETMMGLLRRFAEPDQGSGATPHQPAEK